MTISNGSLVAPERLKVGWFECEVPPEAAHALAEYAVTRINGPDMDDPATLAALTTVVFVQQEAKLGRFPRQLEAHAAKLLDWGCQIVLRAAPGRRDTLLQAVQATAVAPLLWNGVGENRYFPHLRFYDDATTWQAIAADLRRSPRAPAPYVSLEIVLEDSDGSVELSPGKKDLLQRAFHDCAAVYLRRLPGGLSGADVFVAHPTLKETYTHGRHPLPYFVKIDERAKVIREYANYQERVDPHVPFHLGPHLIAERCGLGATLGVLVGDFVEESESLVDCARAGRASAAIACLFNRTLHGWHRDARLQISEADKFTKGAYGKFPPNLPVPSRQILAKALGAELNPAELNAAFEKFDTDEMYVGPIHGDLNARNVRVRGGDAIIIDFLDHREDGDILWDVANLEASLFFDGFEADLAGQLCLQDMRTRLSQVGQIYAASLSDVMVPPYPAPGSPVSWFYECVRQVRRYAVQWEHTQGQYAALLGRAFLKKAYNNKPFNDHEEHRRAAAYVLAERVLTAGPAKLSGMHSQTKE